MPSDRVRLLAGADARTEYQWLPPGKDHSFLHFRFCKACGIRSFGVGGDDAHGRFCFVNLAASASVKYADGKNDRFREAPADTRLL